MTPILSIIIPHRNSISKLRRLLNSIDNDQYLQIIVIDDNSDTYQRAGELCADFPHVEFLSNPGPAFNAGSARNYGLKYAISDWVFFADADDYFVHSGLSIVLRSISKVCAETDIIFFNLTSYSENNNSLGNRHKWCSEMIDQWVNEGDDNGLRYSWPAPWGKAIRHDLIKTYKIEFDSLEASNDVLFSLISGHNARNIACVAEVVYCITESEKSLTAALTPARALCRLDALTRRNINLLNWKTPVRLDWGLTYFLRSRPWSINLQKINIYVKYVISLVRRLT